MTRSSDTPGKTRVLDLIPIRGSPAEVFIDDSAGWVGYQTGRDTVIFNSLDDGSRVAVIRWGVTVGMEGVFGGRAIWSETLSPIVPATDYNLDLAFPAWEPTPLEINVLVNGYPEALRGTADWFVVEVLGDAGVRISELTCWALVIPGLIISSTSPSDQ